MIHFIQFKRGQQFIKYTYTAPRFEGNAFLPQYALIPLSFQTQMTCEPLVSAGDIVHEGQMIARAGNTASVHVHASVPGTVSDIVESPLPNGRFFRGIRIKTGGAFDILGKTPNPYPWQQASNEDLLHFIELSGIVNTANGITPLAAMLRTARQNGIQTLTARFYDKDPSCGLDSFLAKQFLPQVVEGVGIAAQALGASKVIIEAATVKKNRTLSDTAERIITGKPLSYISVPETYPAETPRTVAAERTTFVIDAATAIALYESVYYNQPMLSTYVVLTGKALGTSKVLKVRIGTPIDSLIEECGGFKSKHTHIVMNGLLRGIPAGSLDIPVGKGIKSIHAAGNDIDLTHKREECGHCGQCLRNCPAYLDPIKVVRAIESNRYTPDIIHAITVCRRCACCSAGCPSRIPLCAIIGSAAQQKGGFSEL